MLDAFNHIVVGALFLLGVLCLFVMLDDIIFKVKDIFHSLEPWENYGPAAYASWLKRRPRRLSRGLLMWLDKLGDRQRHWFIIQGVSGRFLHWRRYCRWLVLYFDPGDQAAIEIFRGIRVEVRFVEVKVSERDQ